MAAPTIVVSPSSAEANNSTQLIKSAAVYKIERWWMAMKDKRLFQTIKNTLCSAEHSLTHEILRKLSPREATLLKDPSMQTRVKFRLDGTTFPPTVVFKIYSRANSVHYISGRDIMHPISKATEDARQQMGNRLFYDQLLFDSCHHLQHSSLTDITDVTTIKDYMKYMANLDETPAIYGGKENYWRKLNLDGMSRYCPVYNVLELTQRSLTSTEHSSSRSSCLLTIECGSLQTSDQKTIFKGGHNNLAYNNCKSKKNDSKSNSGGRYSQLALKRVEKMRKSFIEQCQQSDSNSMIKADTTTVIDENDALELYQWSQELSFEDLN